MSRRHLVSSLIAIAGCAGVLLTSGHPAPAQSVTSTYAAQLTLQATGATVPGYPTQMAWGPDGRLYVMTTDQGVWSYAYNPTSGTLSNSRQEVSGINGIGIGFHYNSGTNKDEMFLTAFGSPVTWPTHTDSIWKLTRAHGTLNAWGGTGEVRVAIVTGVPTGDHDVDQIQIVGDTLYVGVGRRTINGFSGDWTCGSLSDFPPDTGFWSGGTGKTYGDSAYGGTICMIQNLNHVVDTQGSADTLNPKDNLRTLVVLDKGPYQSADNKLIVHSAGTRNPFGLCLDRNNNLYFTNNFNRVKTKSNGQSGFGLDGDVFDSNVYADVHDQLFAAAAGADYGYHSSNWVNKSPFLMRSQTGHVITRSISFDNLYKKAPFPPYDPTHPVGLGPSASADGCSFWYNAGLPSELYGRIFIARYNNTISTQPVNLTYADLIAVDVTTENAVQVAYNFQDPLAVIADLNQKYLLIADYGNQTIYAVTNQ